MKIINEMIENQNNTGMVDLKSVGLCEPFRVWLFRFESQYYDGKQNPERGKLFAIIDKLYRDSLKTIDIADIYRLLQKANA